jgi:hypothetical protein
LTAANCRSDSMGSSSPQRRQTVLRSSLRRKAPRTQSPPRRSASAAPRGLAARAGGPPRPAPRLERPARSRKRRRASAPTVASGSSDSVAGAGAGPPQHLRDACRRRATVPAEHRVSQPSARPRSRMRSAATGADRSRAHHLGAPCHRPHRPVLLLQPRTVRVPRVVRASRAGSARRCSWAGPPSCLSRFAGLPYPRAFPCRRRR